jgi:hypothetical protein
MKTTFYILLHVKTPKDMQTFGKFYIGNDHNAAYKLFNSLKGSTYLNGNCVLFAELMETQRGLPVNIKMLACTLNELSENCRIITKEIFKLSALESI